jgi:uncharacterized tellurite resistance protein B-like protein
MHIVLALLAILGGGAFWWYRMRNIADAASEVHDVAGRAWGKYKRAKFRNKVNDSPLEAVQDPTAAAMIMLLAIAKADGPISERAEAMIARIASEDMQADDATELMTFSKWVAGHVVDPNDVARRYSKLWGNALNLEERRQFLDMARRIAAVDGAVSHTKDAILARLKERLGFTT